jgi:ankyrin repeat protein
MEPDIIRGALNNDMAEVQAALDLDPRAINKQHDFHRYTALHIAAGRGNVTMVEFLLLQPRLRFGIKDRWDRDPLDVAILAGHPGVTRVLFRFRAEKLGLAGEGNRSPTSPTGNVVSLKPK